MKKIILLLIATFGISQAQVKVISNGNVGIGTSIPQFKLELANSAGVDRCGIKLRTDYSSAYSELQISTFPSTATEFSEWKGKVIMQTFNNPLAFVAWGNDGINNKFEFYVGGRDSWNKALLIDNNGRVGIGSNTPGGKLEVSGGEVHIYSIARANSFIPWSDSRLKTDVTTIRDGLNTLLQLRGVTYYPIDSMEVETKTQTGTIKEKKPYGKALKGQLQIGFIAQEVEKILPNVVSTAENGFKGVNYISIVPILVEALKEQQTQIEILKADVKKLKGQKSTAKTHDTKNTPENGSVAFLYQNTPNPFNKETVIKYYLPEAVTEAGIYIYDLNGKQLKAIKITLKGESSVSLFATELSAGMYMYALIADGNVVDSKRMVIVE